MTENDSERGSGDVQSETLPKATGRKLKAKTAEISANVASKAGKAVTLIGDLNGDGKVDAEDAKIASDHAAVAITVAADETGKLAKSIARAPLTKDVATYAAVGAAIALPLPVVGPAIGAAVGAGLGLWRNMTRSETFAPPPPESSSPPRDPISELERLHELKERGIITEEEFIAKKRKLLR